jgi:Disulfide bond formation protein DsbB
MAAESPPQTPPSPDLKILWPRLALFVSVVGVVGSLYLSLQMELKACPLCFYQRAFIMSVAAILGFGLYLPDVPKAALTPLALAPAMAGAVVAITHVLLVVNGILECPMGVTGFITVPGESLIVYVLLMSLLLVDLFHNKRYVLPGLGAVLIGYILASTSIKATPPVPDPTGPYPADTKLDGCRKVYREKT